MTAPAASRERTPGDRRLAASLAAAALGLVLFHLVSATSGKVDVSRGLGWDGEGYAQMTIAGVTEARSIARTRPLLPLVARIPYAMGLDVVTSYHLLNYLYAFVLYLAAGLILDRYGAATPVKFVVVANLALCIAASKMFAFYPVQIDLGALALTTVAFYLVCTDRRWLAAAACVLAAASREFGVLVAIYGVHRAIRLRRPVHETALVYLPAVATVLLIRSWVLSMVPPDTRGPLSIDDARANLELWSSPAFAATFGYFAVTLFGGITALLVVRGRWVVGRLRQEPELATYLLAVIAMAAAGSLDIWRYLAFALPAVVVLIALYFRDSRSDSARLALFAMTFVTLLTQRPFERMSTRLYFRDWFPLYGYLDGGAGDLAVVWAARFGSLVLLLAGLYLAVRANREARGLAQ